jgi:redox-sensitive bicupin YhaK (pirin superfamily)|tara:strand:- start:1193 stop:2332 length:1140 start_codon:yes stop_codon:yes gene_type:complete
MKYLLNRRQLIKVAFGSAFSFLSFSFGINKFLNRKSIGNHVNSIKKATNLPDRGPWPTLDPFLFCVYHNDDYPSATNKFIPNSNLNGRQIGNDFSNKDGWSMYHGETVPGFPKHPHRGFETLTVVEKGIIDHSDSLGATARYGDGDAQWLTAGDGINHSEMFPLFNQEDRNKLDFFQIWINLPSNKKRVSPNFLMFWEKQIPKIRLEDNNGVISEIEIISGDFNKINGPVPPPNSWANNKENQVAVWVIHLKSSGSITLPKAKVGSNRCLYILKDTQVKVNNDLVRPNVMVELYPENKLILENSGDDTKILMLQGNPINEPVAKYGPFVMNTRSEIEEAFKDYNTTGFGGWKWEKSGPIHGKYKGKFAKLINGKIDKPT